MIWESGPWKDDLLRRAVVLKRLKIKSELSESDLVEAELTIMVSFYIIRKLIEAQTMLSTKTINQDILLAAYPATGKNITLINWHKIDQSFDMGNRSEVHKKILFICNQFIHSYIFVSVVSEQGGLSGILFSSDREKSSFLYQIDIDILISLLKSIGKDYPVSLQMELNPTTGDYDVQAESEPETLFRVPNLMKA